MQVEILTTGDELCRGEVVDTNAAWLGDRLRSMGVPARWLTTVGDPQGDIEDALGRAAGRADLLVVSGGLGPTDDDRTAAAAAAVAGVELGLRADELDRIRERFAALGREMTPNNEKQARLPVGARPLANDAGTAPGFELRLGRATAFFLPGVPRELVRMFDRQVAPRVAELAAGRPGWAARRVRTFGLGESKVETLLAGLLDGIEGASLHYRAAFPEVLVTVAVRAADDGAARATCDRLAAEVKRRLGQAAWGEGDDTLARAVGRALRARGWSLALAESCTGGLLGHLLTEVPGASDYLRLSVVAYANEAKQALLGVSPETLARAGAVSRECVLEMAHGARRLAQADLGLAVSGIAGPGGGTPDKPVGTVELALVGPEGARHRRLRAPGDRAMVKSLAAHAALALALGAATGAPAEDGGAA